MTAVSILRSARTPHGQFLGGLSEASAVDLGAWAIVGVLDRLDHGPSLVEWVVMGNAISAGLGQVPARQLVIESVLTGKRKPRRSTRPLDRGSAR